MIAAADQPFERRVDNAAAVRGFVLAALVHVLLIVFLYFGVSWQIKTPEPAAADMWEALPKMAASAPPPPRVEPVPEPQPEPKPEPVPEPKPVIEEPAPPPVKAEIEQKVEKKKEPPKKKQKEPEPKKEKEPPPKKELVKKEVPKKEVQPPPVDDPIKRELAKELQKQDMARQMQKEDLSRQLAQESRAAGQRASGEWAGRVGSLVRSKVPLSVANAVPGNPMAVFEVSVLPGGVVGMVKLIKSSGYPAFDDAAERAVQAISPLPPRADGTPIPRTFQLEARPKDQ